MKELIQLNETDVFNRTWKWFKYDFTFVFRYKGDSENQKPRDRLFKGTYKLGIFYKKTKVVKNTSSNRNPKLRFSELVPSRVIGVDLIWCKFWINWDKDSLNLTEK